jgi:hypothetical protein
MRKVLPSVLGAFVVGAFSVVACSGTAADPSVDGGLPDVITPGARVTFHKDIEPIVQERCQTCHSPGGIGPFSLMTYADAKDFAPSMVDMTASKKMPPWGAHDTAECKPRFAWKDDLRLSDAQIALFKAWSEQGAPEGDPKEAPQAKPPAPIDLPGASTLVPPNAYSAVGKTSDVMRCFVMDPKLTKTTFMTASHFVPKNKTIVHHALAFAAPASAKTPGDALEYDCSGGPNVANANLIAAWAPGSIPARYPDGVALPLEAGTKIIMQVHYHPHANATPDADQTTFQYATTDVAPKYVVVPRLIGNFQNAIQQGIGLMPGPADPAGGVSFLVPRNVKGHTETMAFTMPTVFNGNPIVPMRILNVGAHMHIVGVDQKLTIKRAAPTPEQPADECLLQEPMWNFDWQRGYQFDTAIDKLPLISPGDKLEVRCTYDNTMGNMKLKAALAEQGKREPEEVKLGEQTLDEMCLASLAFVRPL